MDSKVIRKPKSFRKYRSTKRWRDKQQTEKPASKPRSTQLLIETSQTLLCIAPVKQWETEPPITAGTERETSSDRRGILSAADTLRPSVRTIRAGSEGSAILGPDSTSPRLTRTTIVATAQDGPCSSDEASEKERSLSDASRSLSAHESSDRGVVRLKLAIDLSNVPAACEHRNHKPSRVPSSRTVNNVHEAFRSFSRFVHGQRESDSATTYSSSVTSDSDDSNNHLQPAHKVPQQASASAHTRLNRTDLAVTTDDDVEGNDRSSYDSRDETLNLQSAASGKLFARVPCHVREIQATDEKGPPMPVGALSAHSKNHNPGELEAVAQDISSASQVDSYGVESPSNDPMGGPLSRQNRSPLQARNTTTMNTINAPSSSTPGLDLSQEEPIGYVANDDTSSERHGSDADSESTVIETAESELKGAADDTDGEYETAVDYGNQTFLTGERAVEVSGSDESGVDGFVTVMEQSQDYATNNSIVVNSSTAGLKQQADADAATGVDHQSVTLTIEDMQQHKHVEIAHLDEADSVSVDIDAIVWADDTSDAESQSSVHDTKVRSEENAAAPDTHVNVTLTIHDQEIGEQGHEHRRNRRRHKPTSRRLSHDQDDWKADRAHFGRLSPISIAADDGDNETPPPELLGDENAGRAGSIDIDSDSIAVATDNDDVAADETVVIRLEDELSNRMISYRKPGEEAKGVLRDVEDIWQEISGFAKNTPRHYHAQMSPIICFPVSAPVVKRKRSAGVSRALFPPIAETTFGLFQEKLWKEPFWLLIVTTFLNKTSGNSAAPIFWEVKRRYPTPEDLAHAELDELVEMIRVLGLQRQRALRIIKMAQAWCRQPPQSGEMYRVIHYPFKGDGKEYERGRVDPPPDKCVGAIEIGYMPGCGPYAYDSWRIFCRDVLRGLAQDYNGLGSPPGFEPEWKRVQPLDKELRPFLRWMWLKEGWLWDAATGKKRPLTKQEQEIAVKGEVEPPDEEEERVTVAAQRNRQKDAEKRDEEAQRPNKKPRQTTPSWPPRTPSPSRRRSSRLHQ